ncbi:hypothetical protein GALL_207640 [mine drainage metagenome]|uniref:DUF2184 domain-containing protein n=1 Tax=mine drainage metagenome TaxID=410659 RepID=A0A1J5RNR7_9ZZZZ
MHPELAALAAAYGIHFPEAEDFLAEHTTPGLRVGMDAQPGLVTTSNAGIPAFLSAYVDPKLIEVLVSPNKAAEILGEQRKGDWLTETALFPMVESTGETSAYGDFAENGRVGANVQFENRQSYLYQTMTEWGERELERMGLAKVDWAARLNIASAVTLNKFQNLSYFYGISGLQTYGLLNDPSLSAAITPATKAAGGTGWKAAQPQEILADIQALFAELQAQTGSVLEMDAEMTLALHAASELALMNTNQYGRSALDMIKVVFPNLRVVQAAQYLSGGVYSAQLIVREVQGQEVGYCAFNEKLRAHRLVAGASSFRQKKTQGTWGAIITFPAGIAQMTGL